jgi:hypothetical protein
MNFISIGSWCGPKIALKALGLFNEPSLPFDSVRSSIEGVIDCIENNFENYFPKEIKPDELFPPPKFTSCFIGRYIGFYHPNHNLLDKTVIESFERKFVRFAEKIKKNNCVFLRSIATENYNDEIKYYKRLQEVIDKKYPDISYIICFIISNQPKTLYYNNIDERTFIFTLNDLSHDYLKEGYKPIFDFIANNNLFVNIPPCSKNIKIINAPSRIWLVDGIVKGIPMVKHIEN